jgi:predicted RNase H-like HicB family nuclease
MRYLVIYEQTETGYSAYAPDLPGCISTGLNKQDALQNLKDAIRFHIEGLIEEGMEVPEPKSEIEMVEII